jgi:asparagine synthase (glutamine-hydrolysing)
MAKINLQNNKGFTWFNEGPLHVKGYVFDRRGTYYSGADLLTYFSDLANYTDFAERVTYANGLFSVIFNDGSSCYAACDPFRNFPLYYTRRQGNWEISDDPFSLITGASKAINSLSYLEFLAAGYVTGCDTLIEGIRQVQAGESIHFKADDLFRFFYSSYRNNMYREDEYQVLREEGLQVIHHAFARFVKGLQGRTLVLPLSGGYDSRLIAVMLKRMEYPNVVCLTYGRAGNSEAVLSKKVAEQLGFPWIFVEYTPELINSFTETEDFKAFATYSGGLTSMFYLQEFFAIRELASKQMVPADSIFAPGLLGDFLAGGLLNKTGNLNMEESIDQTGQRIYDFKYIYKKPPESRKGLVINKIERTLLSGFRRRSDFSYSLQEDWEMKERYGKFIINSANTYTFFGYEFRLPFADRELVNFFRSLPLHAKVNKYLYDDVLISEFFDPFKLNFPEELQASPEEIRRNILKRQVKKYLPEFVKRPFTPKSDKLFYREITDILRNDLLHKGIKIRVQGNSYNSLIIQWYAEHIKSITWQMNQ